jgi:carbamoyl-phosphate synthase small subunit
MITAQNHGFAVDEASMPANLRVTHKSLFDGTLQGFIARINRHSASRATLKRARARTTLRRCSTILSS